MYAERIFLHLRVQETIAIDFGLWQQFKELWQIPTFDVSKFVPDNQDLFFSVECDGTNGKSLHLIGEGFCKILFLHDNFILEFAFSSPIECHHSISIDTEETLMAF